MDDGTPLPIPLRCLGGEPAPPELAGDLRRVVALPAEALRRFWHVLGPSLDEPLPPQAAALLDAYCKEHQLDASSLARAVKACRFLLREAAGRDLSTDDFVADVAALQPAPQLQSPGAVSLSDLLRAGYERARAQVRAEILRGALSAHGNLLVGLDWRVDTMETSDRGARLRAPVALVTLRYREGGEQKRITLQVLPDMLAELEQACHRMLS